MGSWQAFQADVLDTMRQYRGYMDFYEQASSMDRSRPDCFCRVSRGDKKEIWIVDAKDKDSLDQGDIERMEKYSRKIRAQPVNVGLEPSQVNEYTVRTVFVTSGEADVDGHENVPMERLHQFLQHELVYTDTDTSVQHLSKMVKKRELNHSQARLLYRSLRPYIDTLNTTKRSLEEVATKYSGFKLMEPPISSYDSRLPVDAVMKHEPRGMSFLIDVPYSKKSLDNLDNRVEELRELLSGDEKIFYAAINRFDTVDSKYVYTPGEIENELRETASVLSAEEVAEWFRPKIPLDKSVDKDGVKYVSDSFTLQVSSEDDVHHTVEVIMPRDVASELSDMLANSRKKFGEMHGPKFRVDLEVTPEMNVRYSGVEEPVDSFATTARNLFRSTVSRELAAKVSGK